MSNPTKGETTEPESLEEVMEQVEELGESKDKVSLGDALDMFGDRSFAPMFILLPLIELSPLGGIPGVPTLLAIIVALLALQMLFGKEQVWLPDFVENRQFSGEKLAKATHKLDRMAAWVDKHIGDRMDWLLESVGPRLAAVVILLLCLSVPPLEFLPFASAIPMLAIALVGLALLVRDGLLLSVALVLGGGAVGFAVLNLLSGSGSG